MYCLSKCLACKTANTVGGCSLAGTNGAKLKYHWSDKDEWTRTTRGWRRVISDLLGSNSKDGSVKLKEVVSNADEHKAKPDHVSATVVPQGGAGDRQHIIASDGRPHAAYPQKGHHGDQPRQRSHPNSPASPPDMVEPVSQLPSSDPFADSNENKELYRNFGPSFSDIQYITPRVRKHRHPPKNDFCARDRWSPPMMLSTELLNDHRRISPTFDGARQLSYGSMPIRKVCRPHRYAWNPRHRLGAVLKAERRTRALFSGCMTPLHRPLSNQKTAPCTVSLIDFVTLEGQDGISRSPGSQTERLSSRLLLSQSRKRKQPVQRTSQRTAPRCPRVDPSRLRKGQSVSAPAIAALADPWSSILVRPTLIVHQSSRVDVTCRTVLMVICSVAFIQIM